MFDMNEVSFRSLLGIEEQDGITSLDDMVSYSRVIEQHSSVEEGEMSAEEDEGPSGEISVGEREEDDIFEESIEAVDLSSNSEDELVRSQS